MPVRPARRRLPRFSLRSLILFVALFGCGYGLWAHWEPWVVRARIGDQSRNISSAHLSPDGSLVVTSTYDGKGQVWKAATGKPVVSLSSPPLCRELTFSADGNRILGGVDANSHGIWDVPSGKCLQAVTVQQPDPVTSFILPTGNRRIEVALHNGEYSLFDIKDGRRMSTIKGDAVSISQDGRLVAFAEQGTSYTSARIHILDTQSGKTVKTLETTELKFRLLEFSPRAKYLLSVAVRGTHHVVALLEVGTGIELWRHEFTRRTVDYAFLSQRAKSIVTIGPHTGLLWNSKLGKPLHKLASLRSLLNTVTFPRDGDRFAIVDTNWFGDAGGMGRYMGHAEVYDSVTGKRLTSMGPPDRGFAYVEFAPGGDDLLTYMADNYVLIYHRRRPEYWWGVAWLPEFWLTLALGAGLMWSLWRDRGMRGSGEWTVESGE